MTKILQGVYVAAKKVHFQNKFFTAFLGQHISLIVKNENGKLIFTNEHKWSWKIFSWTPEFASLLQVHLQIYILSTVASATGSALS